MTVKSTDLKPKLDCTMKDKNNCESNCSLSLNQKKIKTPTVTHKCGFKSPNILQTPHCNSLHEMWKTRVNI